MVQSNGKGNGSGGVSGYADELTSTLSHHLDHLAISLVPPTPPVSLSTTSTARASTEAVAARLVQLQAALSTLSASRPSTAKLASLIDSAFPPFQGLDAVPLSEQTESVESLLVAQLTIATYGLAVRALIDHAGRLEDEDVYWSRVESGPWETGVYLLQTIPARFLSVATTSLTRLRALTPSPSSSPTAPLFPSLSTIRKSLPPSLLITSMFPHLQATQPTGHLRQLLFLTFSPLVLTRQEVTLRREAIRDARADLARKLGSLSLSLAVTPSSIEAVQDEAEEGLGTFLSPPNPSASSSPTTLLASTYTTIRILDSLFSLSPSLPPSPPRTPSDLAHALHHFLARTFPDHEKACEEKREDIKRPGWVTRYWTGIVGVPLGVWLVGKTVYNSRETLVGWVKSAKETVEGFLVDWVLTPITQILSTIRHSDSGLALMPKESLNSDLDSLERMVMAFGKDQFGLQGEELRELGERVRVGDLGSVMRVWEEDIKSPIKSAVTGSLIRTLLIQIQKVKVDMLVMVEGVEKMLHSQQLTFGFVGVAPSLLVLYGVQSWVRGLLSGEGRRGEGMREVRKRCWSTMRHLDALLSSRRGGSQTPEETQGHLLLALSTFRGYASSQFPTRDTQLRDAFLDDVRALERGGAQDAGLERLWRWSGVLGWDRILL